MPGIPGIFRSKFQIYVSCQRAWDPCVVSQNSDFWLVATVMHSDKTRWAAGHNQRMNRAIVLRFSHKKCLGGQRNTASVAARRCRDLAAVAC